MQSGPCADSALLKSSIRCVGSGIGFGSSTMVLLKRTRCCSYLWHMDRDCAGILLHLDSCTLPIELLRAIAELKDDFKLDLV
jgi:hypothetical protein